MPAFLEEPKQDTTYGWIFSIAPPRVHPTPKAPLSSGSIGVLYV